MNKTKPKTKRQLNEEARAAAMEGRWEDADLINRQILERFPREAEAYNRIGRSQFERGRYASAFESYAEALKLDPANMIARRNLQRLEFLRHRPESETTDEATEPAAEEAALEGDDGQSKVAIPRTTVFIEEVGKTWVDELIDPAPKEELALISSGQQLTLDVKRGVLWVLNTEGKRLGKVEAKTAERMIALMKSGNRYEVYAVGMSSQSLRVILREVYRDPSQARTVSFPRQVKATRAYLRERDLLRQRDEADFLFSDEDEDEDDEDVTAADDSEDSDDHEPEADAFIPDAVVTEDEEV